MEAPIRALVVYVFLLVIFRITGKRTLAQITTFDFVLLLILGEATQQGLIGNDFSVTKALLLIASLLGIDAAFSFLQNRFDIVDRLVDSVPVLIMEHGKLMDEPAKRARISETDVMEQARRSHGLERLDQIKYAVLERDGGISVIPKAEAEWRAAG